ncbi:dienelactone hydrolase family protein [Nocardiopsis sp. RSe5-2]|uniref:Dienelactone hydrolase family protein n=1 Tax=Nocardiopsis endophytica TaxID=3018445 RepID=A0ABT4U848_9ACTN|nr:dienelactone hydrolase family protein [Nocardiopsis endophytica]MDA2813133.1 dienelactone hydrolase family protein [Nocardiopsis endophytica]
MAEIVVFHHALGLTPGVRAFAEGLGRAGHRVHVPDLYEGRLFGALEEGVAHAQEIGIGAFIERGTAAAESAASAPVCVGFSLGVLPAQKYAQTAPGVRGAVLLEACVPRSEFGPAWPSGVPVQVHGMDADPFFAGEGDLEAAMALAEESPDAEVFLYPGDRHLFTDSGLASYDPTAAEQVRKRVLAFLARIDAAPDATPS